MVTVATPRQTKAAPEEAGMSRRHRPIAIGMEVIAEDGRVGNVRRVLPEWATTSPTHLVLHVEEGTSSHVIVPLRWAIQVTPERVVLRARRRHLARLPQLRPDNELAAEIRLALASSTAFRSPGDLHGINVSVCDGVAFLTGHVRTLLRAVEAEMLAQEISGIIEVHNDLTVDDELKQAVVDALRRDPQMDIVDLSVEVELGTIRLRGRATSPEHCALVLMRTRGIEGVSRVVCLFDVDPPSIEVRGAPAISRSQVQMQWSRPATVEHGSQG